MGQCSFKQDGTLEEHRENLSKLRQFVKKIFQFLTYSCFLASLSKNNFTFQQVIGRGGFGKVSLPYFDKLLWP